MNQQKNDVSENRLVVPQNRVFTFVFVLCSLAIVFVCVLIVVASHRAMQGTTITWGYHSAITGAVFIGSIILFYAVLAKKKMLMNTPCLIVDEKGITDNSTTTSLGFVPWSEIGEIHMRNVDLKFIEFELKNEKSVVSQQGAYNQNLIAQNKEIGFAPGLINLSATKADAEEVYAKMKEIQKRAALSGNM